MDVFELLKKDHEKVAQMLERLDKSTTRAVKTRQEVFAKLRFELDLHADCEEQLFYPRIKDEEETREVTLEGIEEHRVVRRLLEELSELSVEDDVWSAKLSLLKEMVEHHVEEEEQEMFKEARKVLSEEEIEEIGERIQAMKAGAAPGRSRPTTTTDSNERGAAVVKKSGTRGSRSGGESAER